MGGAVVNGSHGRRLWRRRKKWEKKGRENERDRKRLG